MIKAVHTLIYSDDPEATRSFLRDVPGWPYVEHPESRPGWLIFKTGPSEMGVHPTSGTHEDFGFGLATSLELPGAGEILPLPAPAPRGAQGLSRARH